MVVPARLTSVTGAGARRRDASGTEEGPSPEGAAEDLLPGAGDGVPGSWRATMPEMRNIGIDVGTPGERRRDLPLLRSRS